MNPEQTLLHSLHDIHLPPAISAWPWAPGWIGLLGLGGVGVVGGGLYGWRWLRRTRVKRAALRLLAEYEQSYHNDPATPINTAVLNELLKRVALAYFPREQVAALHGLAWLDFLQNTSKQLEFLTQGVALQYGPYQPNHAQDLRPLLALTKGWITQRGTPCST